MTTTAPRAVCPPALYDTHAKVLELAGPRVYRSWSGRLVPATLTYNGAACSVSIRLDDETVVVTQTALTGAVLRRATFDWTLPDTVALVVADYLTRG